MHWYRPVAPRGTMDEGGRGAATASPRDAAPHPMLLPALLALSTVFHFYVAARLVPDLPSVAGAASLATLLAASALLSPMGLLARRLARPPAADALAWSGMLCMGVFSSLLVFTVLRDVLLLLAWAAAALAAPPLPEGARGASAAAVPLLALLVSAVGFLNARRVPPVVRVRVPIDGLPPALEGLRIVQITDIHVGPTIKQRYLDAVVEAVNRLQPDVVAVTGDLVDGAVAELRPHVAPLARLRARHGSFFVTGNHEYYSGVGPWLRELESLGLQVLLNRHVVLEHQGARLVLAGIPDWGAGAFDRQHRPDAQSALHGAPADVPKVLLAHQPRSASMAEEAGFDLQLSGHTHGGQFLPWTFFVRLQQPYTAGLHRHGRLWLYVSRGTGYWGPPKRFGAPSEITEIELIRSS